MAILDQKLEGFSTPKTAQRKYLIVLAGLCSSILLGFFFVLRESWLLLGALIIFDLLLFVLAWPEVATLVFVFVAYINLLAIASQFYGVPTILAASFTLILIVPLASYVIIQRRPLVFTPSLPLMLAYLAVLLVSALLSGSVQASIPTIVTFLTEGLLLYFFVSNCIRTPATLRRVVWVLLLVGSLLGALSIYQEMTHSYHNNFGGLAQVETAGFKVGENVYGQKIIRPRLAGPIGEKNRYAQIMLMLFPLALFRFWGEPSRLLRVFAAIAGVLILGATLLTFSRGAAVALFGLLVVMIVLRYVRLHQIILILLAFIMLIVLVAPDYIIRLDSLQGIQGLFSEGDTSTPDGAIVGRVTENLAALHTFLDHPILGVGPGQFFTQYSMKVADELGMRYLTHQRRAHSLYLETAADTGIIGLVSFMAIAIVTIIQLWRIRRFWLHRRPEFANMATAFLLSVLAYLMTGVFLHLSYQRYYWFLLALANSAIYAFQHEAAAIAPLEKSPVENSAIAPMPLQGDSLTLASYGRRSSVEQE